MLGLRLGQFGRSRKARDTVACPYCGKELRFVPEAVSIPCSKCSRRVDLEDLEVVENISRDLMTGASVHIRKDTTVTGNVHAARIVVLGTVKGNIHASRIVRLHRTARIFGDIKAPRLELEEGARVVGRMTVTPKSKD
jgi:predicted acyltransferase (DUF342 family)